MRTHVLFVHNASFQPLADLVMPYWVEWCDRHNYDLNTIVAEADPRFHYSFEKMSQVLWYLTENDPAELLILDVDMLPTNLTLSLHDVLGSDYSAITMTRDINGLNNGATLLRYDTQVTRNWLKLIIAMKEVTTSELHAMWILDAVYKDYTRVAPHPSINSIDYLRYPAYAGRGFSHEEGLWMPGDLLVHFPGMNNQERIALFKQYIPLIQR